MRRKISKFLSMVLFLSTLVPALGITITEKAIAAPSRIELTRATEAELKDTLVINGTTWKKVSGNSIQTHTFPEIRFSYFRKLKIEYYIEWVNDGAGVGHFDKGKQPNYWSIKPVNGEQRGYGSWPDESLWNAQSVVVYGDNTGADFFNKQFSAFGEDGMQYTFVTGKSFTGDVYFYATKETIEAFLKSKGDPNATFNIEDYKQEAKLETRLQRPVDPIKSNSDMKPAPPGIDYRIYDDYLKDPRIGDIVESRLNPGSPKPTSSSLKWKTMNGGRTYVKSGEYGDQIFNYMTPEKSINIGYKATYESEVAPPKEDIDIPPSGGGGGKITFTPPSTPWTNKGKASGFPVQVSATNQAVALFNFLMVFIY